MDPLKRYVVEGVSRSAIVYARGAVLATECFKECYGEDITNVYEHGIPFHSVIVYSIVTDLALDDMIEGKVIVDIKQA
jgi:hypothetical protein